MFKLKWTVFHYWLQQQMISQVLFQLDETNRDILTKIYSRCNFVLCGSLIHTADFKVFPVLNLYCIYRHLSKDAPFE